MKLREWIETHSISGDLCAPEMDIEDASSILVDEILGGDFHIPYSCNGKQALAEIVAAVVRKVKRVSL